MTDLADTRLAAEAIAHEMTFLALDRTVFNRSMGIIRENRALLAAAQNGNPYLNGVRRWWAMSTAMILRRNIAGGPGSLRQIVEALAEYDADRRTQALADIETLDRLNVQFRTYFNGIVHGGDYTPGTALEKAVTFNELTSAVESVVAIAERTCSAILNVAQRLDPVMQFDWTTIFREPWIDGESNAAYKLGDPGVPSDAEPLSKAELAEQASLTPDATVSADGSVFVSWRNDGKGLALDARLFLPFERTVLEVLRVPANTSNEAIPISAERARRVYGQAVIEFSDVRGRVFREYADVALPNGIFRNLRGPYLVHDRIVAPANAGVA